MRTLVLLVALWLSLTVNADQSVDLQKSSSTEARLKSALPKITNGKVVPDTVEASPVPGIYEVRMGLDIFYVDSTGRYAFVEGALLDLKDVRNLTQERLDRASTIDFKALPFNLAIKTVRGNGKRTVAVFEDPACPYCRSLRTLLNNLDDVTIYAFPFPVLSQESDMKTRMALCATDRKQAWEQLMTTGQVKPVARCSDSVDALVALGQKLSVRGTPTIFFANGRRAQGAIPPDQFMAMLQDASQ